MKKISFTVAVIFYAFFQSVAQNVQNTSKIDFLLIRGNYQKVIDTCKLILAYDSLNPELYYKMAIAYQNIPDEDLSLNCFYRAAHLHPDNKAYNFSLAKTYYSRGKYKMAEPFLNKLLISDPMNWGYAYYLSGIYMQTNRFDDAINIYKSFLIKDSTSCVYLDKMAFASLKKGDFQDATNLYNKSLSINNRNLTAIKNLSYLYTVTMHSDTAIQLLSRGIEIDSTDLDLYAKRAQINFAKHYTKRALDDYLFLLASGDSSKIYLKRAGIGYCYNLQPREAIGYLLKAYSLDSADDETCNYLGQCYFKIKDMKSSIYYYNRAIELLSPSYSQLGFTYSQCAESQKSNGNYKDAIDSYLKAYAINADLSLNILIANIYDEKLNNRERAVYYYRRFLNSQKNSGRNYPPDYIKKVEKRLEYLKNSAPK